MWPTPKATDADRGGRGDLIQAVRGNPSPSGHFSPASEASTSASTAPVCELCGSASRTPTASGSSPGTGLVSRATRTCAPLWPTPDASVMQLGEKPETWLPRVAALKERVGNGNGHGMPLTIAAQIGPTWRLAQGNSCPCRCHTSTSSAAASPAKTSPSPAEAKGSTGHARVFGQSTPDSFATYDPATSSWRTSQLSLLEEWSVFSGTWPRAGMTRSGTAYPLRPLAPLTAATGSGLWPTPSKSDPEGSRTLPEGTTATGQRPDGKKAQVGLPNAVKMWRTPQSGEGNGGGQAPERRMEGGHSVYLRDQILESEGSGSLNPTWVSVLMGFPPDWTEV